MAIIDALARISDADEAARLTLFNQNGVSTTINALSNHMTNPLLVNRALGILCNTMAQGEMFVAKVIAHGGCRPIIDAMREHPRRPKLLTQGCCALINAATASCLLVTCVLYVVVGTARALQPPWRITSRNARQGQPARCWLETAAQLTLVCSCIAAH